MKDPSGLDLLVALLGTLGALLLLVAAFAAAAQCADIMRTARAVSNFTCSTLICGAGTAVVAAAPAPAVPTAAVSTPPAPSADTTMPAPTAAAVESGGGGSGGCTVARGGAPELALPLALVWALAMSVCRLITHRPVTGQRDARTVDLAPRA
jgi:hypothetical protein